MKTFEARNSTIERCRPGSVSCTLYSGIFPQMSFIRRTPFHVFVPFLMWDPFEITDDILFDQPNTYTEHHFGCSITLSFPKDFIHFTSCLADFRIVIHQTCPLTRQKCLLANCKEVWIERPVEVPTSTSWRSSKLSRGSGARANESDISHCITVFSQLPKPFTSGSEALR